MARTFLFFYVYTVPFALLSDKSNQIVHCIEIFVLTYGFMGLETVSIELDNPFGDDDNDFDNLEMAYVSIIGEWISMSCETCFSLLV
jgi:predicted membrane chloride channel (bestrophin family)